MFWLNASQNSLFSAEDDFWVGIPTNGCSPSGSNGGRMWGVATKLSAYSRALGPLNLAPTLTVDLLDDPNEPDE